MLQCLFSGPYIRCCEGQEYLCKRCHATFALGNIFTGIRAYIQRRAMLLRRGSGLLSYMKLPCLQILERCPTVDLVDRAARM